MSPYVFLTFDPYDLNVPSHCLIHRKIGIKGLFTKLDWRLEMQLEVITREPETGACSTPILFVHGYWHAAWCWEQFLTHFARHGYVSHALSLRGHGKSEGYEKIRWIPLSAYVDDLAQVADQLERSPVLVGHSMGGMIVQKYLEKHQAPAVVLLASAPPKGVISSALRMASRFPLPFLMANLTLSTYRIVATPSRYRRILFSGDVSGEELTAHHAHVKNDSYRAFMDMMFLDLPRPKNVNPTPMLVLGSSDDLIVNAREVEATARAYGTQPEIFTGMGHAMMLDVGWQAVADRILGWLNEQGL
jgi:pimeloyl-ACP methyl ester carboxylesterase